MTVVVLAGAGRAARRYQWSRGRTLGAVASLIGALTLSAAAGYWVGARGALSMDQMAHAEASLARAVEPTALPVAAKAQGRSAAAPTLQAPAAPAEPEVALTPGPALQLSLPSADQPLELHPLSADGKPMKDDYELVMQAFACEGEAPAVLDSALIEVLTAAYQHFGRPIQVVGGRCGKHGESHGGLAHHAAGRGADIRMRGVATGKLSSWLTEKGVGGVGRYKGAGFVHLDVRSDGPTEWEPGSSKGDKADTGDGESDTEPGSARREAKPQSSAEAAQLAEVKEPEGEPALAP